jgi:hypothetical protein
MCRFLQQLQQQQQQQQRQQHVLSTCASMQAPSEGSWVRCALPLWHGHHAVLQPCSFATNTPTIVLLNTSTGIHLEQYHLEQFPFPNTPFPDTAVQLLPTHLLDLPQHGPCCCQQLVIVFFEVMFVVQSAERVSKVLRCILGFLQAAAEPLHGRAGPAFG